jgi:DNA-binding LytR/AlgR family response regulator
MEKLNCIIVEDEPLAAEMLQDYISRIPFLNLAGTCSDALYALDFLQKQSIDVIFLDIHMPKLKGLDFIKTLNTPYKIIITSAYREYALDGFELNVVDYLLKPFGFTRFLKAINKLTEHTAVATAPIPNSREKLHILINVNKKRIKLYADEICYAESQKEYLKIVTTNGSYTTKLQINDIATHFGVHLLRVHRSFIIARNMIDSFNATQVEIKGYIIPIGRSYKEAVLAALHKQ